MFASNMEQYFKDHEGCWGFKLLKEVDVLGILLAAAVKYNHRPDVRPDRGGGGGQLEDGQAAQLPLLGPGHRGGGALSF